MKAIIKTNYDVDAEELMEIKELLDIDFLIEPVDSTPIPTWNPYFKAIELDWKWFKSLFGRKKADIYCYVGTEAERKQAFITKYWGLYNLSDKDDVHDFWFFIKDKLDKRAKKNGFKTNFAWLFIHEYLHGKQHFAKERDSVHKMEEQGRLKELLPNKKTASPETKKRYLALLKQLVRLLLKLRKYQKPLPIHWDNVTQEFLNYAPETYKYGYHPGTDFAAPLNTPILAPADGEITRTGYSSNLGYWSEFKFDNYWMVSLHLRQKPAERARKKGEPVGFVGNTGLINGVHAHLELWNKPMDRDLIKDKESINKHLYDITYIV